MPAKGFFPWARLVWYFLNGGEQFRELGCIMVPVEGRHETNTAHGNIAYSAVGVCIEFVSFDLCPDVLATRLQVEVHLAQMTAAVPWA